MDFTRRITTFLVILLAFLFIASCESKKGDDDLESLSPLQIVELYHKANNDCDRELLRKIIYFPPEATEAEIEKRLGPSVISKEGKAAERMMGSMKINVNAEYEKIITEDTAEVGVVAKIGVGPLAKRIPGDQIILKKDENVWKIHYSRGDLSKEQLIDTIKKNPQTAWAYYYLGMKIQSENPYRAYKYYEKYYKLEPEGFWVNRYREEIDEYGNAKKMEQVLLESIRNTPKNSDGQAVDFIRLCQLFTEDGNSEKAQLYIGKAEEILSKNSCRDKYIISKLEKAKKELQLRKEGKYIDFLDEIEKSQ